MSSFDCVRVFGFKFSGLRVGEFSFILLLREGTLVFQVPSVEHVEGSRVYISPYLFNIHIFCRLHFSFRS